MKSSLISILLPLALLFMTLSSYAAETTKEKTVPASGQPLHDTSCQSCHDNTIYTRTNSIIFSRSALNKRVRFCESMTAADWTEAQMKAVIGYLNQQFYHFKN